MKVCCSKCVLYRVEQSVEATSERKEGGPARSSVFFRWQRTTALQTRSMAPPKITLPGRSFGDWGFVPDKAPSKADIAAQLEAIAALAPRCDEGAPVDNRAHPRQRRRGAIIALGARAAAGAERSTSLSLEARARTVERFVFRREARRRARRCVGFDPILPPSRDRP